MVLFADEAHIQAVSPHLLSRLYNWTYLQISENCKASLVNGVPIYWTFEPLLLFQSLFYFQLSLVKVPVEWNPMDTWVYFDL